MRLINPRRLRFLLGVLALTMAVSPVATVEAAGGKTSAASAKLMAKQIKALKKQTATLTAQLASVQAKMAALEGQGPTVSPLSGPAGGDLVGAFPNPQLRPGTIVSGDIAPGTILGSNLAQSSVDSSQILDSSILSADIVNATINENDLAADSVGASELGEVFVEEGFLNTIGNGDTGGSFATCPADSLLIGGMANWLDNHPKLSITTIGPSFFDPTHHFEAGARNESGSDRDFIVRAVCLRG